MADAHRRDCWSRIAVLACAVGNSFRSERNALKISSFPYCKGVEKPMRQSTRAEFIAFAEEWNKLSK